MQQLSTEVTNLTDYNCVHRQRGSAVPGDVWAVVIPDLLDPDGAPRLQLFATAAQNPASMTIELVCEDSTQELPYYPFWTAVQFGPELLRLRGVREWDIHPTESTLATRAFTHSVRPFDGITYDVDLRLALRHPT